MRAHIESVLSDQLAGHAAPDETVRLDRGAACLMECARCRRRPPGVSRSCTRRAPHAWAAATTHPMVRAIARRVAAPRDVPPLLHAERPVPRGVRPRDRAHRGEGARPGRDHDALPVPGADRRERDPGEPRVPRTARRRPDDRRRDAGRCCRPPTRTPATCSRPACWATAPTGSPRCCRASGATASSRGRSRRTRPAIRSMRTGSRCSATTRTTGWSRRRPRCSTGSSIPATAQDGGALADLRAFDALRSGVLGHGVREPPAGRSPRRRRNPLDACRADPRRPVAPGGRDRRPRRPGRARCSCGSTPPACAGPTCTSSTA